MGSGKMVWEIPCRRWSGPPERLQGTYSGKVPEEGPRSRRAASPLRHHDARTFILPLELLPDQEALHRVCIRCHAVKAPFSEKLMNQ